MARKSTKKTSNEPLSPEMDQARRAVLDKALGDIIKRYGEGSIMLMGDAKHLEVEAVPTGSLSLDIALGVGGIPRGRICEIYGPESSGKTTLCLHIVAETQKLEGTAAFIDMEHALDPAYATRLGVNIDQLLVSQPDTGEQALEIAETLVRSGAVDLVIVDSVAALVPRSEIEGDMGDATMGMQGPFNVPGTSQAFRRNQTNQHCCYLTNQLRQKIGVMFGNPETTTGGLALKFYASVRLDIRRIQSIKMGGGSYWQSCPCARCQKQSGSPFRTAEFDIMYNEGISKVGDILDLGTQLEIIAKRGSFYSYGDIRLGQGRENSKEFLRQNQEICDEIELIIRQQALEGILIDTPASDEDQDEASSED